MNNERKCEECGYTMTLLFTSYVCDWCDGLVAKEWDKATAENTTEPLFTGIDWGNLWKDTD